MPPTAQDKQDDDRLIVEITVSDQAGRPISQAQAFIANETANPQTKLWDLADDAGRIVIAKRSLLAGRWFPAEPTKLLVRAPGYGWAVETVDLSKTRKHRIVLSPARPITMNITREDRGPIPSDLQPIIFAEGWSVAAWITGVQYVESGRFEDVFSAAQAKKRGDSFTFDVPADPQPIWILVNHPGYLRASQIGPIAPEKFANGQLDVVLPAPARSSSSPQASMTTSRQSKTTSGSAAGPTCCKHTAATAPGNPPPRAPIPYAVYPPPASSMLKAE